MLILWLCNYFFLCGFDTVSGDFCAFGGKFLALPSLDRGTQQVKKLFPIRLRFLQPLLMISPNATGLCHLMLLSVGISLNCNTQGCLCR